MHSSRFSTFELLRIFIPGMYLVSIVFLLLTSFEIPAHFYGYLYTSAFGFIIASIIAGLSFYAKETSKKRKAFQINQPSTYILQRSREISTLKPLTEDEARRLYFFILNHEMPMTVHDKVFFFGMIYHIMINIRRTSFWFGLLGFCGLLIQIVLRGNISPSAITGVGLIWIIYGLNVRYNKADRKMQENYQDQIFWLEMNKERVDTLILQRTKSH
ncbi:MAG: hypothetical protein PHP42_01105 [Bacteroidota bacterium]|nr:hypothetical protein [Bacteroidota bacterium]